MRSRRTRHNRTARNAGADRGEATAQLVILTPILILLVFLGIQTAIYFHAANVATAAATRGAAAGSGNGAGIGEATAAARQTLDDLGTAGHADPVASEGGGFVTVTVEVDVARVLPFFPDTVTRTAVEPTERFVPESDR
jgi:Flp pilus assembly protein TadG